jgi:UDP-N-acetyl-2-amino-2-deoxyglucuronate dehydrogenase
VSNFALIGAAGFVAPRHMKAIRDTNNQLVAAIDPHDSAGVLDGYFPEARFFTEIERFDRHLEKLRRKSDAERVHYISVATPNYLHDAHVRLALRLQADAICEKPMVINPWNLDQLAELEAETGRRVFTVLQLRHHRSLLELKKRLDSDKTGGRHDVCLTYITRRGPWYHVSWKGLPEKSGGLTMNIGIHFFDVFMWLFGAVEASSVQLYSKERAAGTIELERARVRSIEIDGEETEFSGDFTDLHTRVYEEILADRGLGIEQARPSIDLVYRIRNSDVSPISSDSHPLLR